MRRLFNIYILVLLALGVACQRVDLPDNPEVNQPVDLPTGEIGSKVTIGFSTADVTGPETRGIVNAKVEVETLHLIVFDENGMLVEVCKAEEHGSSDHDGHVGGRHYSVTLTVTDKPRIIHYVANCPVNQVVYGHETSVIGNMFVDRNHQEDPQTEYEVSYWARIEVPYILVEEKEEEQADGSIKNVLSLVDTIEDKFMHVPLLRNYAEITVTQDVNNKTFEVLSFTVYNLINRGTVAPYNSNTQQFQSFFERDGETITKYLYPQMYKEFHYEGHALTSAELITDLVTVKDENGNYKVKEFLPGEPFYVYERKVSVMTDEEEKWRESPPHIIIKARYSDDEDEVKDSDPIYYYKMDLVYTEDDGFGTEEVKYYNILRNFMYKFNITKIHDVGYRTLDEAVAGAAGNNISGSSTTSKLTNVSDDEGRLWVSYTDITLVTGEDVVFRYKYIPNYYGTEGSEYTKGEVKNELVNFQNIEGDVITGIEIAESDAADGWREVTIHVNAPSDITHQQILYLKTDNSNLNRQIRHTLRKKLTMQVECTPKVKGEILQPVKVDIKLPVGMTEDMFPLTLNMETEHRTLSPDATANENPIPVTVGPSIVPGRVGQSYYYTVTIPTFDAYKALLNDGDMKVVTTHWQTNMAANASTFYVENKYFNLASDSWQNYTYTFSDVECQPSAVGEGQNVTISFKMADGAINKQVTIALEGMTYSGTLNGVMYTNAKTFKYTTSSKDVTISEGLRTTTATDAVSFTLDADGYNIASAEGSRLTYKFGGAFAAASLETKADAEVDFTFTIEPDALAALKTLYPDAGANGVPMFVTLNRLQPADDQLIYSQAKAGGDRYIYRIKQAGTQTIKLATTDAAVGDCTVTLEADYFDTQNVTIRQKGMEFRSLTLPASVQWGTGKAVNITFQLAAGDSNRDVTVVLENMARGGNTTLTFNTGNSGGIVTNNNGTYTITNVVTTSDYATLKVSISASGYDNKEMTIQQNKTEFRSLTIPDEVSGGTGKDVNIAFQLAAGDSNRDVTVVLENMAIGGKTTLTFNTGNSNFVTNNNGTYTIKNVVTTGTADATLKVKISALGYEDKEVTCSDRPSLNGKISFASASQRTSIDSNKQVWTNDGITLTNEKSSSNTYVSNNTNPVRFYRGQKLTIGAPGVIKSITFVCNNSTYATNLKNSIGTVSGATVTTRGSNVTVTFTNATATQFVINLTADVRMNSLSVVYYQQQ